MLGKLRDFWDLYCGEIVIFVLIAGLVGIVVGGVWWGLMPTTYDFGNGAILKVPFYAYSNDKRQEGYGVVVEAGTNVTVINDSSEWRTLTVSYRRPNIGLLSDHAFEDLPPKSSKVFGVEPGKFVGMYVSVSDHAQKKRDKEN